MPATAAIRINVSAVPDFRSSELAEGALQLTKLFFSSPEVEEEYREYRCYLFYKRTHTLDSKEMARLIDGAIYVAKGLGIDTDTPEQIARYKEEWHP